MTTDLWCMDNDTMMADTRGMSSDKTMAGLHSSGAAAGKGGETQRCGGRTGDEKARHGAINVEMDKTVEAVEEAM